MTRIYDAHTLAEGTTLDGPALVESPRTSFLVEPGWQLTMGTSGAAWLEHTAALAGGSAKPITDALVA